MSLCFLLVVCIAATQGVGEDHKHWQSMKKTTLERNQFLLNNTVMSDIKITFEESKRKWFYGHKLILASRSPVFHTKFYQAVDSKKVSAVHLSDVDEESVLEFLRFLYTDECIITLTNVLDLFKLTQRYVVPSLEAKCVDTIVANATGENVLFLLEQTRQFEREDLREKLCNVVDHQTRKVLASEGFLDIAQATLVDLLKRDTLQIKEIELFKAVLMWSVSQCIRQNLEFTRENARQVLGNALYELRFLSMTREEFAANVPSSGLLLDDEIVSIYQRFMGHESKNLKWYIKRERRKSSHWLTSLANSIFKICCTLICGFAVAWLVMKCRGTRKVLQETKTFKKKRF